MTWLGQCNQQLRLQTRELENRTGPPWSRKKHGPTETSDDEGNEIPRSMLYDEKHVVARRDSEKYGKDDSRRQRWLIVVKHEFHGVGHGVDVKTGNAVRTAVVDGVAVD